MSRAYRTRDPGVAHGVGSAPGVYRFANLVPASPPPWEIAVRPSRLVLAALFALVGLVWIGQGVGLIGGSVMTGSPFWAIVGAALLVVAVVIVMIERRRPTGS